MNTVGERLVRSRCGRAQDPPLRSEMQTDCVCRGAPCVLPKYLWDKQFIQHPFARIIVYILPNIKVILFVANNMVII